MKQIESSRLSGVVLIEPDVYSDDRGFFIETYHRDKFDRLPSAPFVQDNMSFSPHRGTIRGLHFQLPPYTQAKLVHVLKGKVLDVIVDLRPNSGSYGLWESFELSEINHHLLYVPRGFAHGFQTDLPDTLVHYKCDNLYNKDSEGGIIWNDPELNIPWPVEIPVLSPKDRTHPVFRDIVASLPIDWSPELQVRQANLQPVALQHQNYE